MSPFPNIINLKTEKQTSCWEYLSVYPSEYLQDLQEDVFERRKLTIVPEATSKQWVSGLMGLPHEAFMEQ